MSDTTTITDDERMEKALARAQAFVKLHGHDNTACITSGELFLFRDAIKCAQTEIEHWGKLYLMMTKDEQRLTKERDWLAKALAEDGCPYLALWSDFGSEMRPDWCICIDTADDGFDCNGDPKECWKKEAARRAVADSEVE